MFGLGYEGRVSFWHHIVPRDSLEDKGCLVDHFHLNSIVRVEVEESKDFLDVKTIKNIVNRQLKRIEAPLPMDEEELKKLADSSGNVGQAGDLRKPDTVYSVNEQLGIEDASAEYLVRWLCYMVKLELLQLGYGWRQVYVYFRETEKYYFTWMG